jgi:V-type H+-transporting ATPase subunit B
VYPKEMI